MDTDITANAAIVLPDDVISASAEVHIHAGADIVLDDHVHVFELQLGEPKGP